MDLVDLVGRSAGDLVPLDPGLGGVGIGILDGIDTQTAGAVGGCTLLVDDGDAAQIQGVVGVIALDHQTDAVQSLAGVVAQVAGGLDPALALGQLEGDLLAVLIGLGGAVAHIGDQAGLAQAALGGQVQLHAAGDLHEGGVQQDVVAGIQIAGELDGGAAVEGVLEVIGAGELAAVGIDDPGEGGQHVLVGLVGPLGVTELLAAHEPVLAVAGVEVGDEGSGSDGALVCEESGHAGPGGDAGTGHVHAGVTGIAGTANVVALLGSVEVHSVLGHGLGLVGVVKSQRQLGHAVLVHQQVVPELVAVDVGLHVEAGEGVILAAADGLHGVDGGVDLGGGPVVVHKELVHAPVALLIGGHPELVGIVDGILVGNAAGLDHGVVPGDDDLGALLVHVAHHLVEPGCDLTGAAVGLLVEEPAVEAVVVHHLDELVGNGEGAVLCLLAELADLLDVAVAGAPGEAQDAHDGHAVGVGSVDDLTGGSLDEVLTVAAPVDVGIHILPVVESIAEHALTALGQGIIVVGTEHQLCLGVGQGIYLESALTLGQGDACTAVGGVGIGFRRPGQQLIDGEGRTLRSQRLPGLIGLARSGDAALLRIHGQACRQEPDDHGQRKDQGQNASADLLLHE